MSKDGGRRDTRRNRTQLATEGGRPSAEGLDPADEIAGTTSAAHLLDFVTGDELEGYGALPIFVEDEVVTIDAFEGAPR